MIEIRNIEDLGNHVTDLYDTPDPKTTGRVTQSVQLWALVDLGSASRLLDENTARHCEPRDRGWGP